MAGICVMDNPMKRPNFGFRIDSRDSRHLLGFIFGEHDDGGMNIKGLGELLGALLADVHFFVFQQANVRGTDP